MGNNYPARKYLFKSLKYCVTYPSRQIRFSNVILLTLNRYLPTGFVTGYLFIFQSYCDCYYGNN